MKTKGPGNKFQRVWNEFRGFGKDFKKIANEIQRFGNLTQQIWIFFVQEVWERKVNWFGKEK